MFGLCIPVSSLQYQLIERLLGCGCPHPPIPPTPSSTGNSRNAEIGIFLERNKVGILNDVAVAEASFIRG